MRKLIVLFMLLIFFGSVSSAHALSNSGRIYQIELIVFSHITPHGLNSEEWPSTPTNFTFAPATVTLNQNDRQSFAVLPRSHLLLATEQRLLEKNKNYHV